MLTLEWLILTTNHLIQESAKSIYLCLSIRFYSFLWRYSNPWLFIPRHLTVSVSNLNETFGGYLTYMQSTSWETLGWRKHKLESRLPGKLSPQICRWYHPYGRKRRRTKEPLDESERGEWKSWLKAQHSKKLRSWHLVPSLHGK